jgi:siroheme synthase-like protein
MALYPIFLRLAGRPVLLVGGGRVAASKLRALVDAGALVTVVAPEITDEIARAPVALHRRSFETSDLDGVWLVVAAAPREVNREVSTEAHARGIFVNAVDDVESASAYAGAVLRHAGVTVAISTDGEAPALAGLMREALETVLPEDLEAWVAAARESRVRWLEGGVPMERRRPLLLDALVALYSDREHGRERERALAVTESAATRC